MAPDRLKLAEQWLQIAEDGLQIAENEARPCQERRRRAKDVKGVADHRKSMVLWREESPR